MVACSRKRASDPPLPSSSFLPDVPLHPGYPPRRRAERLSYSVWLVIRDETVDLQTLLETMSTAERLRMALRRIRGLSEQLP